MLYYNMWLKYMLEIILILGDTKLSTKVFIVIMIFQKLH